MMCVLWAALLLLDWFSLPHDSAAVSMAARRRPFDRLIPFPRYTGFEDCPLPPRRATSGLPPTYADYASEGELFFIFRTPTGIAAMSARGSIGAPAKSNFIGIISVRGDTQPRYEGFWAPTAAVVRINTTGSAMSFAPADRAGIPAAIFRAVEPLRGVAGVHPVDYWLLKAADSPRTTITPPGDRSGILAVSSTPLIGGFVHNTAAAGAASLLLGGLARLARRAYRRHSKRSRRSRGLCPACGYDLRGEFEAGCPECGWNRRGS